MFGDGVRAAGHVVTFCISFRIMTRVTQVWRSRAHLDSAMGLLDEGVTPDRDHAASSPNCGTDANAFEMSSM